MFRAVLFPLVASLFASRRYEKSRLPPPPHVPPFPTVIPPTACRLSDFNPIHFKGLPICISPFQGPWCCQRRPLLLKIFPPMMADTSLDPFLFFFPALPTCRPLFLCSQILIDNAFPLFVEVEFMMVDPPLFVQSSW